LDLPEVSLVAILDADKEGYLRSATSLIQTMGRCARHLNGRAILYADVMTGSMRQAIDETDRRRAKQLAYNAEHGITPQSIIRPVDMKLVAMAEADYVTVPADDLLPENVTTEDDLRKVIAQLEAQMRDAAKKFEFERAAGIRDRMRALQQRQLGGLLAALDATVLPAAVPAAPAETPPPGDAQPNVQAANPLRATARAKRG
jgi:excinuclease ABC subunit B